MTRQELDVELKALADLHQRMAERYETLSRRLRRHFDAEPGGDKKDSRLTMAEPRQWPFRKMRDEDGGSD